MRCVAYDTATGERCKRRVSIQAHLQALKLCREHGRSVEMTLFASGVSPAELDALKQFGLVVLLWAFILGTSTAMLVRMFRRGRMSDGHGQLSVLPPSVRRWMLGEPRQRDRGPRQ
jgi:hypothetical protein